jgi:hypothetical protein
VPLGADSLAGTSEQIIGMRLLTKSAETANTNQNNAALPLFDSTCTCLPLSCELDLAYWLRNEKCAQRIMFKSQGFVHCKKQILE